MVYVCFFVVVRCGFNVCLDLLGSFGYVCCRFGYADFGCAWCVVWVFDFAYLICLLVCSWRIWCVVMFLVCCLIALFVWLFGTVGCAFVVMFLYILFNSRFVHFFCFVFTISLLCVVCVLMFVVLLAVDICCWFC